MAGIYSILCAPANLPGEGKAGRAAVVVPNGMLFGDGVCARIKEDLLKNFNLHTVVRLPEGTFAPYTDIPANLLFFDRTGPTQTIWYYQVPLPEGRKKYTKTMPMQPEDMTACKEWFLADKREENEQAWPIPFKKIHDEAVAAATPHWEASREAASRAHKLERQAKALQAGIRANGKSATKKAKLDELNAAANERRLQAEEQAAGDALYWPIYNLDHKNPNSADALEHLPPEKLVAGILQKEREILRLMEEVKLEVEALG
ncbi:MAG: N-6 DNA methylase [Opitutales bacterium]|nr:N-6 DNA methylase [Opitutales bacterium]